MGWMLNKQVGPAALLLPLIAACEPRLTWQCYDVAYEPRGAVVTVPEECPPDTCPYTCGSNLTCDADPGEEITCESCRDLVEYFAFTCQTCFVRRERISWESEAPGYAFECWGEQK